MPANESGVSAPFWPYGVTSGCMIIEHLLVADENEGAVVRNVQERPVGPSGAVLRTVNQNSVNLGSANHGSEQRGVPIVTTAHGAFRWSL